MRTILQLPQLIIIRSNAILDTIPMLFLVLYLYVMIQQKYLSLFLGKFAASNVLMNHVQAMGFIDK